MRTSEERGYASGVSARSILQDLIVFAKSAQDRFMNTLPNAGLHPVVKATPASHAATAAELTRQILLRYFSPEDEQDSHGGRSALILSCGAIIECYGCSGPQCRYACSVNDLKVLPPVDVIAARNPICP